MWLLFGLFASFLLLSISILITYLPFSSHQTLTKLVPTCHREPLSCLLMHGTHGVRHGGSELSSLKCTKEEVIGMWIVRQTECHIDR